MELRYLIVHRIGYENTPMGSYHELQFKNDKGEWVNEARLTLFLTYLCLCVISFMVEVEIRDKKKRLAEDLAREVNNNMYK